MNRFSQRAWSRAVAGVAMAAVAGAAAFAATPAPSHLGTDIPTVYPKAYQRWLQLTPKELAGDTWLTKFDPYAGGSGPMTTVTVAGAPMIFGSVCERHDCGDQMVGVLISPDQSHIVGVAYLSAGATYAEHAVILLGAPTAAEVACLNARMDVGATRPKVC